MIHNSFSPATVVMRIWSGYWRMPLVAALTMLGAICALPANAQDSQPFSRAASVTVRQVQVAFIGSGALGGGTLYYRGRAFPFKLGGLRVGGFGVSRLEASGAVYNMRNLQDINGVYARIRSGWAIGDQGRGRMWLRNVNDVYLKLQARRQGLALHSGLTAW
jgi:hypothetical protein